MNYEDTNKIKIAELKNRLIQNVLTNEVLINKIQQLEKRIKKLQKQLSKDSHNNSKLRNGVLNIVALCIYKAQQFRHPYAEAVQQVYWECVTMHEYQYAGQGGSSFSCLE